MDTTWTGLDAFGDSIFRPDRPRLSEALSATREVLAERLRARVGRSKLSTAERVALTTDPAVVSEAVETMATRLDAEWLLDGRRMFLPVIPLRPTSPGGPVWFDQQTPEDVAGAPLEPELFAAIASAPRGEALLVENLAIEAARSLAPWGMRQPRYVAWMLVSDAWPISPSWIDPWRGAGLAAWWSLRTWPARADGLERLSEEANAVSRRIAARAPSVGRGAGRNNVPRFNAVSSLAGAASTWWLWRAMAEHGVLIVDDSEEIPRSVAGKSMRDVPNPLDAYLRLWGLGYALLDVRGDAVIVGTVADFKPVSAPTWAALLKAALRRGGHAVSLAGIGQVRHLTRSTWSP